MNGLVASSQSFGSSVTYMTIEIPYSAPITIDVAGKRILLCSSFNWGHGNFVVIKGTDDITNASVSEGYIDFSWVGDTVSLKQHNYSSTPIKHEIAFM